MGNAIGQTLPLAVGIAISPIPIIAAILMLLSPKARTTSVGFLLGWLLGIVVAATLFTLLSSVLPDGAAGASRPVLGVVQVLLGLALLFLAVRQWRGRPRPGQEPHMPKWMQTIDEMSFGSALGLGFLLAAVNPKNLLLAASAGMTIGAESLDGAATAVVIAVFTVVAGSTVLIPVVGYLAASARLAKPLESLRTWLTAENAVIMSVLLLVIGTVVLGKGIGSF